VRDKCPVIMYYNDIYGGDNKITGFRIVIIDITERKQAEYKIEESYKRLQKTLNDTINTLASISENRDPYTSGHQKKVAYLAINISEELGLSSEETEALGTAAMIHDIGKIAIPASILSKPGKVSDVEYKMIKTHPRTGYDIIKNIEFPYPIEKIILQHHERLNGSGYPMGLKEKKIMLEAKILAVADVVEAMSSHRPYRPALGIDKALEEIDCNKGTLYDPDVVEACKNLFTKKHFEF
jgi:putative nucleotidyltransferase with HDIG domain